MRRAVFVLFVAVLFLTGCSKPWVYVGYDHTPPAIAERTYTLYTVKLALPQYQAPVQAAVEKNLAARGWQPVATGGSATVFVLGDVQSAASLEQYYTKLGNGWAPPAWGLQGRGPGWAKSAYGEIDSVALGNPGNKLVIDIFDSANHQLLLRAVAENELSDTEKKNVKLLQKTIHRMLKELPKR